MKFYLNLYENKTNFKIKNQSKVQKRNKSLYGKDSTCSDDNIIKLLMINFWGKDRGKNRAKTDFKQLLILMNQIKNLKLIKEFNREENKQKRELKCQIFLFLALYMIRGDEISFFSHIQIKYIRKQIN